MAKKRAKPREQAKMVRANVEREMVVSPTFVSMYANDTSVQVTPWDIRLIFGVITEPAYLDRLVTQVTKIGEVRMSPQHAKMLIRVLLEQVQMYETSLGPIPQVPD